MAKENNITQAVILAGGRGVRLRPLTSDKPKPMVLVAEKPMLEHILEMLKKNGIKEIVLLLGYMPEKIIEYFGDGSKFGLSIKYSVGKVDWETGTRVREAANLLRDRFLLMYTDNFWPMPLRKMEDFFKQNNAENLVTVYNNKDGRAEYGFENNMLVSSSGLVLEYDRSRKSKDLNAIDIGFFILQKSIVREMPKHNFSFEATILPRLISQKRLHAFRTDDLYYPLTSVSFLPQLELYISTIYGNNKNAV